MVDVELERRRCLLNFLEKFDIIPSDDIFSEVQVFKVDLSSESTPGISLVLAQIKSSFSLELAEAVWSLEDIEEGELNVGLHHLVDAE